MTGSGARAAARRGTVAVGVLAVLALVAGGATPAPVGLVAAAALGGAAQVAAHRHPWARATSTAVLAAVGLLVLLALRGEGPSLSAVLGTGAPLALVGHALSWSATRDLRGGLALGCGLLLLAAAGDPDLLRGLPLVLGAVAVVAAVALLAAARDVDEGLVDAGQVDAGPVDAAAGGQRGGDAPAGDGSRLGGPGGTARAVAGTCAVALVAFLLLPLPQDPVRGPPSDLLGGAADGPGARDRSDPGAWTAPRLDMSSRGDLPQAPVLEVPADSPELWRTAVYEGYDGRGWVVAPSSVAVTAPPGRAASRSDAVVPRPGAGPVVAAPGVPVGLDVPVAPAPGGLELRDGSSPHRVQSLVVDRRAAQTSDVPVAGGDGDARWTRLPATVPPRVGALARQITAGARTREEAVAAVETWMRSSGTYDLESPVPAPGRDAVDQFLFDDDVHGFCETFAAAETVLLRSVGVPARVVTGFGYGELLDGDTRLYRASHRHAWVEVWDPDRGWWASDSTPAASVAARDAAGPSPAVRAADALSAAAGAVERVPGGRPALALGVVALLALVRLPGPVREGRLVRRRHAVRPAGRRPRREGHEPAGTDDVAEGPVVRAWRRRAAREPAHVPSAPPSAVAPRWGLPAAVLAAVEQEAFGRRPPDPEAVRAAVEALDGTGPSGTPDLHGGRGGAGAAVGPPP